MNGSLKLIPLEERIVLDAAVAHVIFVNAAAHSGGDGSSWAHAYNSLQAALTAAANPSNTGDQIWVAKGTYNPGSGQSFAVPTDNISIYGGFAGTETSLSQRNVAQNPTNLDGTGTGTSILTLSGGTSTLDGLTIENANNLSGSGGGVLVNNATLTISNDIFTHNLLSSAPGEIGGGIAAFNSSLTVQ